jgi:hypothetical protein
MLKSLGGLARWQFQRQEPQCSLCFAQWSQCMTLIAPNFVPIAVKKGHYFHLKSRTSFK